MFLVDVLRPRVVVELGTYYGTSLCSFCQAVKELGTNTRCYGIDTWRGDPQGGFFGSEILEDLRAHHDPLYGEFSRLIQSTFSEARNHFQPGSIDLLHIDGYHTYEAVKQDFEEWLPKMSASGVVLLHDINVRERDFGVWKFWDELDGRYPRFEFLHGYGLGLLATGQEHPDLIRYLCNCDAEDATAIRRFFYQIGSRLEQAQEIQTLRNFNDNQSSAIGTLQSQVQCIQSLWLIRLLRKTPRQLFGTVLKRAARSLGLSHI